MAKLILGKFSSLRERRRDTANGVVENLDDMNLVNSIKTDLQFIYGLQSLGSNTLAVIGKKHGNYVLRKYSYNGDIFEQTILEECPDGITKISVSNVPCLAVSYQKARRIDFHKTCEIKDIIATLPCPGPSALCTISSSLLGYVSCSGSNHVCFLDCSNETPRPHATLEPIRLKQARVWSITFSENSYKKMLVVSGPDAGYGKVRAYDFETQGKLLWELSGQLKNKHPPVNPQDVAYNSRTDTLFVACVEGYVYEISSHGKFCRVALSPKQGLGHTCHLIWNQATHLILYHKSKETGTTKIDIFRSSAIYSKEMLSDAFKKACSQSIQIWRARVAVIGTYRVGKTSLVHNLLGLPFVDQYVSTQGIHTQMAQTDKVLNVREVSEWNQIKKDSYEINEDDLQREVLLYIKRNQTFANGHDGIEGVDVQSEHDDVEDICTQPASLVTENRKESAYDGEQEISVDSTPNPDETMLHKILDALVKNKTKSEASGTGNRSDRSFRISIWDFGGQVQFYATHHMFLDPKLVYLLVLDITKDLDSEVSTQFMGMFDCREVGIPKTVREFLDYWLSTIHFQAKHSDLNDHRRSTKLLPPVLIVLTHEDKIPGPDKETYIAKFKKELRRYFDGKAYEPHIFSENIFVIDNKNRDQGKTDELKSTILKLASEQPGWGVPRPANWLRLENAIYRESEVIGTPFLPMGRVMELARELNISDDNLGDFISFHHALGDILYFKDTDKVVTKPQWLIDAFSQVITAPEFYSEKDLGPFKDQVRRLDKEGIASIELLSHMWKDSVNFLLFLMVQFGLMIPFDEEQSTGSSFYIPCMLPAVDLRKFDQELENNSKLTKLAPALVYRLSEGFLPLGSFQKLICQCNELQDWAIHGRVSYNAVLFHVTSLHEILVSLTSRSYGIRFEIWSPKKTKANLNLCKLKETFESILSKVMGATHHTTNICPCENSADAEEGCLIPVKQLIKNSKTNLLYAICPKHIRVIEPDEYKAWFEPRCGTLTVVSEQSNYEIAKENCDETIRRISRKITDESILYDVGMRLGLQHNDIAGIRTDNKYEIQEAGYKVLRFWFDFIRLQSDTTPISQTLEKALLGDTFERKVGCSPKTFQPESHEQPFPAGASTKTQEQFDMNLIRKISKLITDEGKLQDIGVELNLGLDEIKAIKTNNSDSIEQAGYQVLKRWYERQQSSRDHSISILVELRAIFKTQGLSFDQLNV